MDSISYVKDLKEKYFDKKQIEFKKDYFVTTQIGTGTASYRCTLTIPGNPPLSGERAPSITAAENNVAKIALKSLKLL